MLDATRKKSPEAITKSAQHVMGLMFGGAHQLPMVSLAVPYPNGLLMSSSWSASPSNLCNHPEFIEPLLAEITAMEHSNESENYDEMPLMDSFLKETARLNPTVICK